MLSCISTPSSHKYEIASKLFEDGVSQLSFQDVQREHALSQRALLQQAREKLYKEQIAGLRARRERVAAALADVDALIAARLKKIHDMEQEL